MSDLIITASAVVEGLAATVASGVAAVSINAGQSIFLDASNLNKVTLADANLSLAAASCRGIALGNAVAGQRVSYITSGPVTLGAVLTQGKVYVLSANAGGIAPVADLSSGMYSTILGVASSTSMLQVGIVASGILN